MSAIAKLIAGIGLNTDEFKQGVGEVKGATSGLEENFSRLKNIISGAFSVYAIGNFLKGMADAAKAVNAAALESGSTTTGFQALREAMGDAGLSAEKAGAALTRINAAVIEALGGNAKAIGAFNALGISLDDISGKPTDEVFGLMADAVYKASDQTAAYNAVVDILGTKLGSVLLPTLRLVGQEGFAELTDRMRKSGQVMDEVMIARLIDASDRFDDAVNRVKMWGLQIADFFGVTLAGAIEGFRSLLSGDGFSEGFSRAALAYAQNYGDAIDEIVEAQKAANAAMLASNKAVAEESGEIARAQADIAAKAAEDAADRAIEAALRASNEIWAPLEKASRDYAKASERDRLDQMSAEEKLNEQIQLREGLLRQLGALEADKNKYTLQWFNIAAQIAGLNIDIRKGEKDLAKDTVEGVRKTVETKTEDVKITMEQVKAIKALRQLLKNMTEEELTTFRGNLTKIHTAVAGLDFSNLNGLYALKDFKIPNTSVAAAEKFGAAMAAMFNAIAAAPVIPDLTQLEKLKGFDIAGGADVRLGKLGAALLKFIDDFNRKKIDLSPFESLTDLVDALAGGASVSIDINAPPKDQLALSMPSGIETRLASIDSSLVTLAGMKGIIFK